jgi:hypothetical protein
VLPQLHKIKGVRLISETPVGQIMAVMHPYLGAHRPPTTTTKPSLETIEGDRFINCGGLRIER